MFFENNRKTLQYTSSQHQKQFLKIKLLRLFEPFWGRQCTIYCKIELQYVTVVENIVINPCIIYQSLIIVER